MQIVVAKNDKSFNEIAAKQIIDLVKAKPNATLGLATGSTPLGMYENLVTDHILNGTSYKDVTTINLDEYLGLGEDDEQSYRFFMHQNLLDSLDIKPENINIPNGLASSPEGECYRYSALLSLSKIDLQVLGIGNNGHIAFNEPGTSFDSKTHIVDLTEDTIEANSRFFASKEDVPTRAISMGLSEIMKAEKIILLAKGKAKAKAIKELIEGPITEDNPSSILKKHKNVLVILDEEAAGK